MTTPPDCIAITIRDRDFIMAPLNFDQLEALAPRFEAVTNPDLTQGWAGAAANLNAMAEIIHAALSEQQPDLTLEELKKLLNRTNSAALFDKVLEVSGLKSKGEAPAGSPSPA